MSGTNETDEQKVITFGLTAHAQLIDLPDGTFWQVCATVADGTELIATARSRALAAAFLFRKIADHLVVYCRE